MKKLLAIAVLGALLVGSFCSVDLQKTKNADSLVLTYTDPGEGGSGGGK